MSSTSYTDSIVNAATYTRDSIYSGLGSAKDFTVKSAYHIKDFAVASGGYVKDFAVSSGNHIKDAAVWSGHKVVWLGTESWNFIANVASTSWEFVSGHAQTAWNASLPFFQKSGQFLISSTGLFGITAVAGVVFAKFAIGDIKDEERVKKIVLGALALVAVGSAGFFLAHSGLLPVAAMA